MRYTPSMHVPEGQVFPTLPRPVSFPLPRPATPPSTGSGDIFVGTTPAPITATPATTNAKPTAGGTTTTTGTSVANDSPTSATTATAATTLPPLQVGDRRDFWAWDFAVMPPGPKVVHATLRALGDKAQIWVDDAAFDQTVSNADVATLSARLEQKSPPGSVNPTRGVVDINTAYFGPPPTTIDPDPRVTVLLTPFATFNGTSMDGYFNAFDQMPDSEAWGQYQQHSNERNIIYVNTAGSPVSSDYMQGVLAHEMSHLQQFGRAPEQAGWIGETLGEVAMAVNGYNTDFGHMARHQRKPSNPLESDTYVDYGAAFLFGTFLLERYGAGFISTLSGENGNGREAIERTLRATGSTDTFSSLISDWTVANYADARGAVAPGGHHYASLDIPAPAETVLAEPGAKTEGTLKPTGAAYVRIDASAGARVQIEGGAASVRALTFDGPRLRVDEVDARSGASVPSGTVLAIASVGTEPLRYTVTSAS